VASEYKDGKGKRGIIRVRGGVTLYTRFDSVVALWYWVGGVGVISVWVWGVSMHATTGILWRSSKP